jgi:putative ATP-dependent endonuclease of OLD family
MRLVEIDIENFRGIAKLTVPLDEMTVLIGENNTGKSSILEALRICLSRSMTRRSGQFTEYDYHLADGTSQPFNSDPISITLYFKERVEGEWADEVIQSFPKAVQVAADGLSSLTFRVMSKYDGDVGDFVTQWDFLDGAGNAMTGAKNPRLAISLQQLAPAFYLAALRDAAQEFRPRSQFWGPFVRNVKIDDDVRETLEKELSDLNQKVLDAHTSFDDVKERLKKTTQLVPLADEAISIEGLPGRLFDLLSRSQVMLVSRSGAKLPLQCHGEGTQSLAVLFLFDAFLENRLDEDFDKNAEPILAMEEPEAHLHPSAVRSFGALLQGLRGQKIVATHSGELLSSVPLSAMRRLSRRNGKIQMNRLKPGTLTPEEEDKVTYHIRSQRGNLLFARCWLLVEGQSEYWLLPEFARQLKVDLDLNSICCVEYRQFDIDPLIRLADDLGISWHVITDTDDQGQADARKAAARLNGRPSADHISKLVEKDVEHCLWHAGFNDVYESEVTPTRRASITVRPGHADYPTAVISAAIRSTSKPYLAVAVCRKCAKPAAPRIPAVIQSAILTAVRLSEEAR